MTAAIVLFTLAAILTTYFVVEAQLHLRRLERIKYRVHVNGTRGKSSVTRLIAAGLRGGGLTVCAKTTGTTARMILPDARELPIFRPAGANVREQIRVVRAASAFDADVLVIECMALQPELQWLSERWFVRATHGVITNARPDHLDVMGPGDDDVAWALCGMVPQKGRLYTCEQERLAILAEASRDRATELVEVGPEEVGSVSEEDLAGFVHREHADNVALALQVCTDLGVAREVALPAMWSMKADPGVLSEHRLDFFGREIVFYNGFAANDPISSLMVWRFAMDRNPHLERRIALVNCRADRADRSRQLAEAIVDWPGVGPIVLCGTGTSIFARHAARHGFVPTRFVTAEGAPPEAIFETVIDVVGDAAIVVGLGNIGGPGMGLVRMFKNRGRLGRVSAPAQTSEGA
ncbi:MAG: poly-gamma-glutamate synthase PgsB [Myxococcota bacterium]